MSGRHAVAPARGGRWARFASALACHFGGCAWVHDGPGSWSATCSRCGARYHLAGLSW